MSWTAAALIGLDAAALLKGRAAPTAQHAPASFLGDYSDAALSRFADLDPSARALADRLWPRRYALAFASRSAAFPPVPQDAQTPATAVLSADQARLWNAAIPISSEPNPAAKPFLLPQTDAVSAARAVDCLTAAVFYEAASESDEGQAAVAQVVLNRMRHPAFPKTVCGVVFQGSDLGTGCQFTFTCDGSLARIPSAAGWARARSVAERALNGFVMKTVGGATHYHTVWVTPYWSSSVNKVANIGAHIFYRWSGGWGLPGAFTGRWAGAEPAISKALALGALEGRPPSLTGSAVDAPPEPALAVAALVPAPVQLAAPSLTQVAAPTTVLDAGPAAAIQAPAPRNTPHLALPSGW